MLITLILIQQTLFTAATSLHLNRNESEAVRDRYACTVIYCVFGLFCWWNTAKM